MARCTVWRRRRPVSFLVFRKPPFPTGCQGCRFRPGPRTMHGKGVKRLPVTDEAGQLVGIVSRSDLLRPFLRSDAAIREEIEGDVLSTTLRLAADVVHVTVSDGVVTLAGRVEERADIPVIVTLCRSVDGVVALHESIAYADDNLALDVEQPR